MRRIRTRRKVAMVAMAQAKLVMLIGLFFVTKKKRHFGSCSNISNQSIIHCLPLYS